jgi:hypothetical protein
MISNSTPGGAAQSFPEIGMVSESTNPLCQRDLIVWGYQDPVSLVLDDRIVTGNVCRNTRETGSHRLEERIRDAFCPRGQAKDI